MSINVLSARSPEWANQEKTAVNLLVRFQHIDGEIPFTASACDVEAHGKKLYGRAVSGGYGDISPYCGPTAEDIAAISFANEKASILDKVERRIALLERAQRLGIADPAELEELRRLEVYSVELARRQSLPLPSL
ncbi:putative tail protein [Aeromonas phage PVN03]|uniref:Tail protein n=1 Tax=Aeromonas phage PVN03 TaxID=2822864 RepID=A0AAE7RA51_9CAUD|nr:putative tail protein [Aeromonas phage PVN03]QTQ06790.1 putative tail protein [Aeromonas phage PVN03]